ncbi:MAG: bifunctional glutamate N-acetyltransferase/amino-acid acetyltransferase ArgJ [Candidatus Omnitrophota bacterium]
MKIIKGGITAPLGFRAAGIAAGLKKSGRKDLALIFSVVPAVACGAFTANKIKAAPVVLCRRKLSGNRAQAVLVNSGNANCFTGKEGLKDAENLTKLLASSLNISPQESLMASTGVIGHRLPVTKIKSKLGALIGKLSRNAGRNAALAIMTTDTRPKEIAVKLKIGKNIIKIGGIAKGAGMISPRMATMLCFITTDASIAPPALKSALKKALESSFNCVSVDGDMSTNDSLIIMANGFAGNKRIGNNTKYFESFQKGLSFVMGALAKMIAKDGEGASKFIEIKALGAKSAGDAKKAAEKIANSPLVKTAIYGDDPNWGRIAAALGASGAIFNPDRIDIALGDKCVVKNGVPVKVNKSALRAAVSKKDVFITVNLKSGKGNARVWTCDLTDSYIHINARYET